jgi:hypothetical protein
MIKLDGAPYRGANGVWLTEALFYEIIIEKPKDRVTYEPVFSLYDNRPGLINCRTTFVDLRDPTGRKWALTYLRDWNHWLRLMKCPWFQEAFEVWIAELNAQLKSEAIAKALELMQSDNGAQALAAAKFIAGQEYDKQSRGRPTKAEITGELKRAAAALEVEDEDLARIGLKVITGGKSGH